MRRHLAGRHLSIRLRLTLTYAVVFLVTCTALLALNFGLLYGGLTTELDGSPTSGKSGVAKPGVQDGLDEAARAEQAARMRLRDYTLVRTAETSGIALGITVALVLGASWVVARRMLRPLQTLTATTRRISQDRLHERIALAGPHDEIRELADTFDEMVARLEGSFALQRRFVGDASHELRTPLAIVRTSAEVLLAKRHSTIPQWQDMAHRVLTATGRAERMLDGLLALARSDRGVIGREPRDLAVAAAVALGEADPEAESAGLTISTDLRPAPAIGDPILLDRLASNLVDNAIRHNQQGGWVEVATHGGDGVAVVSVRNSGAVIPPQDVDRLFEPFQRLESGRAATATSSGLGLAIVSSIVRAHEGTVSATPLADGGLHVKVTLPAGAPAAGLGDASPEDRGT